jgi:hypothetical protein
MAHHPDCTCIIVNGQYRSTSTSGCPVHPGPLLDWDQVDRLRIARHEGLLAIWQDLPAEEILADVVIAVQLAAFKARQPRR